MTVSAGEDRLNVESMDIITSDLTGKREVNQG
jgi:hypothetical protein